VQYLDAKLTPIRYEEIRHTQAESYQRHQIYQPTRQPFKTPDTKFSTFSALHTSNLSDDSTYPSSNTYQDTSYDYENDYDEDDYDEHYASAPESYAPLKEFPPTANSLNVVADVSRFRSAIAATFRGYCCEQFVFGSCTKRNSGCTYDHSAAGQEMCINSFVLLSKHELTAHSQLPPYPPHNDAATIRKPPSTQTPYSRPNNQTFTQPRAYGQTASPSTYSNFHNSGGNNWLDVEWSKSWRN
jgi:hypothetical protein